MIGILLVIALALFMVILITTQLLPVKYILLAGGVFLLLIVGIIILTRDSKRVGAMICGCLMAMVLLAVLMLSVPYLIQTLDTLDNITTVDVEVAHVGIYVKQDASVQTLLDLTGGSFGILQTQDRENTDKTLVQVRTQLETMQVLPYEMIAELVRKQLNKGGKGNVISTSVDGTGDYQVPYSMSMEAYVMIPDQTTVDAAIAKMDQVKNGEILE